MSSNERFTSATIAFLRESLISITGPHGAALFKALGGHAGDNRQWPDIDAWAEEIAHELRPQD